MKKKFLLIITFATLFFVLCLNVSISGCTKIFPKWIETRDIRIRDPFILVDSISKKYYMYAQMDNRLYLEKNKTKKFKGVEVYESKDLKKWKQPKMVLLLPDNFWGRKKVWAPEVHQYKGKYYLFVTLTSKDKLSHLKKPKNVKKWSQFYKRGTQIFVADSPMGPFKWFANEAPTPKNWMALDGTLWEEDGKPFMVFCHEWVEIVDGTMDYVELETDLSAPKGKPKLMFKASDAPWPVKGYKTGNYVTDGCYMYRTKTGKLLMIWSSFAPTYSIGIAKSTSGKLKGPWEHQKKMLFSQNGGHPMIFKALDGKLMISFHQPNSHKKERAKFFELEDTGDTLKLKY